MDSTGYAYATGRVRAMEKLLINRSSFDRMIDAKAYDDVFKVLSEAGYETDARPEGGIAAGSMSSSGMVSSNAAAGGMTAAGMTPASGQDRERIPDSEAVLDNERKKLGIFIREVSPDPYLYNYFIIRNDFHNLKVLLKAEFSGLESGGAGIISRPALIDPEKLKVLVRDRTFAGMHPAMREAIVEAVDVFGRTGDPQLSDIILDSARFALMREYAEGIPGGFASGLLEILVDTANIKALLRCRKLKKQPEFIRKVMMRGGSISREYYLAMLGEPIQDISEKLQATKYGTYIREGMALFNATGRMAGLEKAMDRCIAGYAGKGRSIAVGPEPVIRYIVFKEFEIMNAGIILAGKRNRISNEVIRERIREY